MVIETGGLWGGGGGELTSERQKTDVTLRAVTATKMNSATRRSVSSLLH